MRKTIFRVGMAAFRLGKMTMPAGKMAGSIW
jgi:hypothetical protein